MALFVVANRILSEIAKIVEAGGLKP